MSGFDSFAGNFSGEDHSPAPDSAAGGHPFDDDYIGYDGASYSPAFPTGDDDGGGAVPVHHGGGFDSVPPSPEMYGFHAPPEEDPVSPPPPLFSSANGNGHGLAELDEGVFSSDGPVEVQQAGEGYALREWRR